MPWIWLVLAMVLLFLEFYLPGGFMALASIVFLIIAWITAFQTFSTAISILFFLASFLVCAFVIRYALSHIKTSDAIFLREDQKGYEGVEKTPEYIGKEGISVTDLGPSGYALIEEKRLQVVCQQRYVEKGEKIVVVDSRGGYLLVQPLLQRNKGENS